MYCLLKVKHGLPVRRGGHNQDQRSGVFRITAVHQRVPSDKPGMDNFPGPPTCGQGRNSAIRDPRKKQSARSQMACRPSTKSNKRGNWWRKLSTDDYYDLSFEKGRHFAFHWHWKEWADIGLSVGCSWQGSVPCVYSKTKYRNPHLIVHRSWGSV